MREPKRTAEMTLREYLYGEDISTELFDKVIKAMKDYAEICALLHGSDLINCK